MPAMAKDADLESLIEAAQKEGCGLQCGYARQLGKLERHMDWPGLNYGLKHQDTDMSSAQEISRI